MLEHIRHVYMNGIEVDQRIAQLEFYHGLRQLELDVLFEPETSERCLENHTRLSSCFLSIILAQAQILWHILVARRQTKRLVLTAGA